jgi:hypothetical protein
VSRSEEYPRADSTSYKFNVEKTKELLYSVNGNFLRYDGSSSTRTLEYYSDGSYILKNWFDVDGYDLEFTVNSDGTMTVNSNYDAVPYYGYDYYWVETTAWNNGSYLCPAYSWFESDPGHIYFYIWDSGSFSGTSGYDIFSYSVTVDDLVGTYDDHTYGDQDWAWSQGASFDWGTNTAGVTIARAAEGDDVNLTISGLAWYGEKWDATLEYDSTNSYLTGNIIINGGQVWSTWYTIGDESSATGDVIATFDHNGNITLKNYYMWYGGYWYIQMTTDLTKSK